MEKRKEILTSMCKLIVKDICPKFIVAQVFSNCYAVKDNADYSKILKNALIAFRNLNKNNYSLTLFLSLKNSFLKIQDIYSQKSKDSFLHSQMFSDLKENAKIFAKTFGSSETQSFLRIGILFSSAELKNITFFEILKEFSKLLSKKDNVDLKKLYKERIDKIRHQLSFVDQSILLGFENSLH